MTSTVHLGDCRDVMHQMEAESVDSIVCDPPYGLSKEPDIREVLEHWLADEDYVHAQGGFMNAKWDSFVPGPSYWRECYRVLKPGGHMIAFGGTRTYDMMVIAVRMAGFEVRDQLAWMYGNGMPKGLNISKAIDKMAGAEREIIETIPDRWAGKGLVLQRATQAQRGDVCISAPATQDAKRWDGWNTSLKPCYEPILLARKPFKGNVAANVMEHGTGALNIDGCRLEGVKDVPASPRRAKQNATYGDLSKDPGDGSGWDPNTGRWPPNMAMDEEAAALLDAQSGERPGMKRTMLRRGITIGTSIGGYGRYGIAEPQDAVAGYGDSGGASRFFFVAKASTKEREAGLDALPVAGRSDDGYGSIQTPIPDRAAPRENRTPRERRNTHSTVKPITLMRWLCRLVTQPGGLILDPFVGSGSTGCAAALEGFRFVGVDNDPKSVEIARARISHWGGAACGPEIDMSVFS